MLRWLTCIAVLMATAAALAVPAAAGGNARTWQAPVKDCTPINGRWGYYGNPWCSPAEQRAWERATSRRPAR